MKEKNHVLEWRGIGGTSNGRYRDDYLRCIQEGTESALGATTIFFADGVAAGVHLLGYR